MLYLLVLGLFYKSIICFPLLANSYTHYCNTNDKLIHVDFEQEDKPNTFGYIYTLNSTSNNLDADMDINSDYVIQETKHAVAFISHLSYSETNSTLLLQAWVSPTNKVKMKQLGNVVHLELRVHSFDRDQQEWTSQLYSNTHVVANIQNMNSSSDQVGYEKLLMEFNPNNTVDEQIVFPNENEQWISWDMSCNNGAT